MIGGLQGESLLTKEIRFQVVQVTIASNKVFGDRHAPRLFLSISKVLLESVTCVWLCLIVSRHFDLRGPATRACVRRDRPFASVERPQMTGRGADAC